MTRSPMASRRSPIPVRSCSPCSRRTAILAATGTKPARMLCLYDNAGEHFQPGQDTTSARSRGTWRSRGRSSSCSIPPRTRGSGPSAGAMTSGGPRSAQPRLSRQETILNEAAARIRRYAGLSHASKYERPLVVIVPKFDEWSHLWTRHEGEPWKTHGNVTGLDVERIEQMSSRDARDPLEVLPGDRGCGRVLRQDVTYIAGQLAGRSSGARPRRPACPESGPKRSSRTG